MCFSTTLQEGFIQAKIIPKVCPEGAFTTCSAKLHACTMHVACWGCLKNNVALSLMEMSVNG